MNYLNKMAHLRQKLLNFGPEHVITDTEITRMFLIKVMATHREFVEQLNLPSR